MLTGWHAYEIRSCANTCGWRWFCSFRFALQWFSFFILFYELHVTRHQCPMMLMATNHHLPIDASTHKSSSNRRQTAANPLDNISRVYIRKKKIYCMQPCWSFMHKWLVGRNSYMCNAYNKSFRIQQKSISSCLVYYLSYSIIHTQRMKRTRKKK